MPLPQRLSDFIAEHGLLVPGARVVVGASGGADSTVLLWLLRETGFVPVAAHVNYGLRGADADADEALVRALCKQWAIPFRVLRAGIEGSVQAAAREARYEFFGDVARAVGAEVVATAHHRDDQAETLLLNLFRGCGPAGLAGMPVRRPLAPGSDVWVVRPLLFASRAEIEVYAHDHGLRWREDASNQTGDYRRNVLRRKVLPLIEAHFGAGVAERLAHAATLLREYLDSGAALAGTAAFDGASEQLPDGWALRLDTITSLPEVVRRGIVLEALRWWAPDAPRTAAAVAEVEALLTAQPGRRVVWPSVTVWRDRDRLVFTSAAAPPNFEASVQFGETVTPLGTLRVDPLDDVPNAFEATPHVEFVDAGRLRFPLTLRPWQPGDTVRPFGLDGHKNVSDVLTDRAVPPHRRARQLVLVSGGEMVWVVGQRLDAAFALRSETRQAVRLAWAPADSLDPDVAGR